MTRQDVLQAIQAEGLVSYSMFEERADASDEMAVKEEAGRWLVYATGERGCPVSGSEAWFDTEEEALSNFLRRLRALNRVIKSRLE